MTQFPNRAMLILVASTALAGMPALAQGMVPNFPIRAASVAAQPTVEPDRAAERALPAPVAVESRPLGDARPAQVLVEPALRSDPPVVLAANTPKRRAAPVEKAASVDATETYAVKRGDTLASIARSVGTDIKTLAGLNDLASPYRLTAGQVLKISAKEAVVEPARASASKASPAKDYVVVRGDSLYAIAKRFGLKIDDLVAANNLKPGAGLAAGMHLVIPGQGEAPAAAGAKASSRPVKPEPAAEARVSGRLVTQSVAGSVHKVRKGETVDKIADDMGLSRKELAQINGLKPPYALKIGQVLEGAPVKQTVYVTVEGDSLALVASRFGVSPSSLARTNGLKAAARLRIGTRLTLPKGYKDHGSVVIEAPEEPAASTPSSRANESRTEPEPSAAEPAGRTSQMRVTGRLVEFAGKPSVHKVRKGDTVDEIAADMGLSRSELAKANKLKPPYALRLGQRLVGPPERLKGYVTVEGDTLDLVARRFSVTGRALASANGLKPSATIRAGRRLTLPDGYRDRGPIREAIRPTVEPAARTYARPTEASESSPSVGATTAPVVRPVTPPTSYNRPVTPPPTTTTSALTDAQISAMGLGRFNWPLRGEILSDFGPKGTGQRNDGLNIKAALGDPVRSAADGDVVYAGNQVPGFGNLVLIKHADGWVTAYGHLNKIAVKIQQKVTQGQVIGDAGQTGEVTEPQLHFEVRYAPSPTERARPVSPQLVLSK